jgi:Flp pilus assembly protein protease CpaA
MIQDIQRREVSHLVTLAMLLVTSLHLLLAIEITLQFLSGLSLLLFAGFLLWYMGIWGASDSKWLVLSLAWLKLPTWADWCILFSAILFAYLIINIFRPNKSLALLIPMNTASFILILFYR